MPANDDDELCEENLKVFCRFRPQSQAEKAQSGRICVEVLANGTTCRFLSSEHVFVFDRVFGWDTKQKDVYDFAAKPIITSVLSGFNGTVFAYGQTASGKTHTMEGLNMEDKETRGVIPRMVTSIFDGIFHADEVLEFLVKVSIVEIYNERIRDLLDPSKDNMKVHEDPTRGVFIGDVTEMYVGSENDIYDALRAGQYNRAIAVTNMNEHSSRSHLIFTVTVEQRNLSERWVKVGKLHLVDLAGSEKVGKTGSSGERLDEAKHINRSLSALGNVINALTDKKATHIPYRDSKLTRVLQESLGGNAKTSLIVTCSPSAFNEQESLSTCRFGQRAKMIKNVVKVNRERSADELRVLIERKDLLILEARARANALEQLLTSRGIQIPPDLQATRTADGAQNAALLNNNSIALIADLREQLQDDTAKLEENLDREKRLVKESDELRLMAQTAEEERARISRQIAEIAAERERIARERDEKDAVLEGLRQEKDALLQALMQSHPVLAQIGSTASLSSAVSAGEMSPTSRESDERHRGDPDRPLKQKVSQLDKNLEQLTVMYHKLVAQNSGLKVEVSEDDKKIQRKDQRIAQLERNLREAKQKYEKLLTQCANLTAAMDVMGRTKAGAGVGRGLRPYVLTKSLSSITASPSERIRQEGASPQSGSATPAASPSNIAAASSGSLSSCVSAFAANPMLLTLPGMPPGQGALPQSGSATPGASPSSKQGGLSPGGRVAATASPGSLSPCVSPPAANPMLLPLSSVPPGQDARRLSFGDMSAQQAPQTPSLTISGMPSGQFAARPCGGLRQLQPRT